jgi:hypothetical protein
MEHGAARPDDGFAFPSLPQPKKVRSTTSFCPAVCREVATAALDQTTATQLRSHPHRPHRPHGSQPPPAPTCRSPHLLLRPP